MVALPVVFWWRLIGCPVPQGERQGQRSAGEPASGGTHVRLVGHSGTAVTEEVYRKRIRPVIQTGAVAMDGIFGSDRRGS